MFTESKNSMTGATNSCPMEADTILKNGRNPKSHTSRRKFLKFMAVLFVASCILVGCNKDSKDDGVVKLLDTATMTDYGIYTKYEYDSQNRLTKQLTYDPDGNLVYTYTYIYNGDEIKYLWSFVNSPEDNQEIVYRKTGNTVTFVLEREDGCYSHSSTTTMTVNKDGYITKGEVLAKWTDCGSEGSGTAEINFIYQGNNLTKMMSVYESNDDGKIEKYTETNEYKYDNKKSSMYCCKTPQWAPSFYLSGNSNNITEMRYFSDAHDGYAPQDRTEKYEYEYDSDGYPIKRITKWDGVEGFITTTYTYITK